MAQKKTQVKPDEAPVENKQAEDSTLSTGITPSKDMRVAAKEEVVKMSDVAPVIADCVEKGDTPPRKLKNGEVYLGNGTIMVNK